MNKLVCSLKMFICLSDGLHLLVDTLLRFAFTCRHITVTLFGNASKQHQVASAVCKVCTKALAKVKSVT